VGLGSVKVIENGTSFGMDAYSHFMATVAECLAVSAQRTNVTDIGINRGEYRNHNLAIATFDVGG